MALPFRPRKRLGQHFLADPNTAARIVGALQAPEDGAVVEIGPGTGALTQLLFQRYPHFTALEVDERAVAYLKAQTPGLDVRRADALRADWTLISEQKGQRLYVVGNLPYNITSPIVFALLAHRCVLNEAILMMQREVAERLVAQPGTKAYGIPSVLTQVYARPRLLFRASRMVFVPRPAVESAVIRLAFREVDPPDVEETLLYSVVRAAFNTRRKTLRNSLSRWTRVGGIKLPYGWGHQRAEDLSPPCFVELTRHIQEAQTV